MLVTTTLKPNSKHREEVVMGDDGSLTVFTKSPAVEGRANEAAARLLANRQDFVIQRYLLSLVVVNFGGLHQRHSEAVFRVQKRLQQELK